MCLVVTEDFTPNDVDVNLKDGRIGWTPLIYATHSGEIQVVQLLLERDDIDVNATDLDGQTALCHAVSEGYKQAIQLLLARCDINPELKSRYGSKA